MVFGTFKKAVKMITNKYKLHKAAIQFHNYKPKRITEGTSVEYEVPSIDCYEHGDKLLVFVKVNIFIYREHWANGNTRTIAYGEPHFRSFVNDSWKILHELFIQRFKLYFGDDQHVFYTLAT